MPFYGGNITYKTKITTPDCKIRINCTYFRGAAVRVYIDGKKHDLLAIPPYSMIADVGEGEHTIEFELLGNRFNTFGDFHNVDSTNPWCTPSSWRTEGSEFCYEYRLRDMGIMKSPVIEILDK